MEPSHVLEVLDALDGAGIAVWIDGGWGIDALIGSQTRQHRDLDLVVGADDLPAVERALAAIGFRANTSAEPGLPARAVLEAADGRTVDLHRVVFDRDGNGWQQLGEAAWGLYPAAGLTGVGTIGGRTVRCLTPDLQLRHHLGYEHSGTDRHDLALLAEMFGLALPPEPPGT